jgi:hypothetical protein
MAYYREAANLTQFNHAMFDNQYEPGQTVTYKGIYKCTGCGDEITVNERFPPQNTHQHTSYLPVRWKLIVWAKPQK